MSLVIPGTMLFAVFGAGATGVAWVLFTPQSKRNDRRYGSWSGGGSLFREIEAFAFVAPSCPGPCRCPSVSSVSAGGVLGRFKIPSRGSLPAPPRHVRCSSGGRSPHEPASREPARLALLVS